MLSGMSFVNELVRELQHGGVLRNRSKGQSVTAGNFPPFNTRKNDVQRRCHHKKSDLYPSLFDEKYLTNLLAFIGRTGHPTNFHRCCANTFTLSLNILSIHRKWLKFWERLTGSTMLYQSLRSSRKIIRWKPLNCYITYSSLIWK